MFIKTGSTSRSTRIRAFALILLMEYDVVFPSIFLNSAHLFSRRVVPPLLPIASHFVEVVLFVQVLFFLTRPYCLFV